jgi:hypothetical protein
VAAIYVDDVETCIAGAPRGIDIKTLHHVNVV